MGWFIFGFASGMYFAVLLLVIAPSVTDAFHTLRVKRDLKRWQRSVEKRFPLATARQRDRVHRHLMAGVIKRAGGR